MTEAAFEVLSEEMTPGVVVLACACSWRFASERRPRIGS